MTVFDRIKELSEKRGISVQKAATEIGFSENLFYQWKTSSPKSDRLQKVADYFNVSTDYLLGRTESEVNKNSSIKQTDDLDEMLDNAMSYEGKKLTEIDRAAIRAYIEGRLDSKWGVSLRKLILRLKENDIKLAVIEMESSGCYLPDLRTMFVKEGLTESKTKEVIYHELKHALDHHEFAALYKITVNQLKMENEANLYMIDEIIKENDGIYNYSDVIEAFKVNMGNDIRFAK